MGVEMEIIPGKVINKEKPSLPSALKIGITITWSYAIGILQALKQMITSKSLDLVGGPVMIISQSFKHAKQGASSLLFFLAYISISLAILNLLPIGALDGGRVLVETLEAVVGRHIPYLRIITNLGTMLILALFVILTYKDILRLFTK